jgi:hypothetical protein
MKFAKQLIALAVVGAAFSASSAFAASDINSGAGSIAATAALDFRVTVPRVVYLQVGTAGALFTDLATADLVTFTLTPAQAIGGGVVTGTSPATLTARVFGNGGTVNFGAAGSGTGLTGAGLPTIPWTQVTPTATGGTLAHPVIGGAALALAPVAGIVNQTTTYSFTYANGSVLPAGTYNGTVTYTATMP